MCCCRLLISFAPKKFPGTVGCHRHWVVRDFVYGSQSFANFALLFGGLGKNVFPGRVCFVLPCWEKYCKRLNGLVNVCTMNSLNSSSCRWLARVLPFFVWCQYWESSHSRSIRLFNPFTPTSDQFQISPTFLLEILHHSLFIDYSDQRWPYYLTY